MKNKMVLCRNAYKLSEQLYDFITNVSSVQEESITEYLVWQWTILNKKVKFFKHLKLHTKKEEARSGADFELELWILERGKATPFIIQAKKIIDKYHKYCQNSLNYDKKKPVKQYELLIERASTENKIPLYMFYTKEAEDKSIYISNALKVKEMAEKCNAKSRTRLSRDEILDISYNIIDLFCPHPTKDMVISEFIKNTSYGNYSIEIENLDNEHYGYIYNYLTNNIVPEYDTDIIILDLRESY